MTTRRAGPDSRGWVTLPGGAEREETDEEFAMYRAGLWRADPSAVEAADLDQIGADLYGLRRSDDDVIESMVRSRPGSRLN